MAIILPEKRIEKVLTIAEKTFDHNNDGQTFYVGGGFKTGTNIVPDCTLGMMGVVRTNRPDLVEVLKKQLATIDSLEGRNYDFAINQRPMSNILYPFWIYHIYQFSGDMNFLEEHKLPLERTAEYVAAHEDQNGFVSFYRQGFPWRFGQGEDWVDWYGPRMYGKTMNNQAWYYQMLRITSYIEGMLGDSVRATSFVKKAEVLKAQINQYYWVGDHYLDNIYQDGTVEDDWGVDSQVWPIVFGVADSHQAGCLLDKLDKKGVDAGLPAIWIAHPHSSDISPGGFEGSPTGYNHTNQIWFGRVGAGDILARYRMEQYEKAYELVSKITDRVVADGTFYEGYNPDGTTWAKDLPGNYLEHAGGYFFSIFQGMFGIKFPISGDDLLTITPRFPVDWERAECTFTYRGSEVAYKFEKVADQIKLTLDTKGAFSVLIRFPIPKGRVVRAVRLNGKPTDYKLEKGIFHRFVVWKVWVVGKVTVDVELE